MKSCLGVLILAALVLLLAGGGGLLYYLSMTSEFSRADHAEKSVADPPRVGAKPKR
jgi:flagellar basal body-associated protein FliL